MKPRELHYLVTHRSGYAVAHCLDLDLMATARSGIEEAVRRLDILVHANVFIPGEPRKSPRKYWKQFEQGTPWKDGTRYLEPLATRFSAGLTIESIPGSWNRLPIDTRLADAA